MDVDDAVRFRRQAEVCREESIKARDLVDAASWLRLADDFENLAARKRLRSTSARCASPRTVSLTSIMDQEQSYRAYLIGRSGQILRRVELLCPDDESAKAHARQLLDGFTVELWEAARLVAVFSPK